MRNNLKVWEVIYLKELFVEKIMEKTTEFLDDNQRIKLKDILTEICLNYQIKMIEQIKKQETLKNNTDLWHLKKLKVAQLEL